MIELKLPELGEGIESAEVSRLLVAEGDRVTAGQNVLELESEKASFPLPCPTPGRVAKIRVKVGDAVSIGQTVLNIEEAQEAAPAGDAKAKQPPAQKTKADVPAPKPEEVREGKQQPAPAKSPSAAPTPKPDELREEKQQPTKSPQSDGHKAAAAGPATRHLARELGVDLGAVQGSERGGRITREDIKAFVKDRMEGESGEPGARALPDFGRFGAVHRQPLNKIARTSAQRLSLAWRTIPHVTQHDYADITELEAGRRRFNEANAKGAAKLTMTVLAVRAAVVALKAMPQFNSSLDSGAAELIVKDYYHIGVAVDTEHGLLVPVLRDADKKTLVQLAHELTELADKARQRALTPKEMEGATFTITNLGGIGGSFFTPIINPPEVAILGIGRAEESPNRLRAPLSLSYDHRVINGADGARFIRKLGALLGDPFRLLAES